MKYRRLRMLTGLGLAVAVLLGSIAPPGHRHAHEGGDVPHDHQQPSHHDVAAHEDHHHHDNPGHEHAGTAQAIPAEHVHFTCWLFELTLPVRDGSDDESSDDESDAVCVVRLIDECPPVTLESNGLASVAQFGMRLSIAPVPSDIAANARPPVWPGTLILLCDTARHERSGVQLF